MENDNYITRDERGHHCYIGGRWADTNYTIENAMAYMAARGYVYMKQTVADSGKPTWWYAKQA